MSFDPPPTWNLNVAWSLAKLDLPVFPASNAPDPSKVSSPKKTPLVKWLMAATSNMNQIMDWWYRWPDALPAIALGKSGLIVFDGDRHPDKDGLVKQDGVTALIRVFHRHGIDHRTIPTVITPSGGRHCFFRQPEGVPLGNGEGSLRGLGINVRGDGGYVIAI